MPCLIQKRESTCLNHSEVALFRISNSSGAYIEVTNYGATIMAVVVPDKYEKFHNVILHYEKLADYVNDPYYMGNTIGRYANRISNASFLLDNTLYYLDRNDGNNSLHGGYAGFNKKIFGYELNNDVITFKLNSPDGEGGYPGNLELDVLYSFSDNNELVITYKSRSTKRTVVNITNHAYFNLSLNKGDILDHYLRIRSRHYLETDDKFIPTGNILTTDKSAYDFKEYRTINEMILLKKNKLKGYNNFFISEKNYSDMFTSLKCKSSGITMDIYTTMPGILVYTGDFLSIPFMPFGGICLESQYHPDGINNLNFISCIIDPYQVKTEKISYKFSVDDQIR